MQHESENLLKIALEASPLGIVVSHSDLDLRYTFIFNPHPDFNAEDVLGKRDDEISDNEGTARLKDLKRGVIESGRGNRETITFPLSGGDMTYEISAEPRRDSAGEIIGVTTASVDVTSIHRAQKEREHLIEELTRAMREVKTLKGIIPICSYCKSIRDEEGAWDAMESYISKHSDALFSHGICPKCYEENNILDMG